MSKHNFSKAITSALGFFQIYGGGVLIKLGFPANHAQLLVVDASRVFLLYDHLNRAISDCSYIDYRGKSRDSTPDQSRRVVDAFSQTRITVNPSDFDTADDSHTVNTWSCDAHPDGIRFEFAFVTGDSFRVSIPSQLCFYIRDDIQRLIDHDAIVDLSDFARLSVHEMEEELLSSEGFHTAQRIRHFELSIDVFEKNYKELRSHLFSSNDRRSLGLPSNKYEHDLYLYEILRLLHNFLAASASLIDHTRVLYNSLYKDGELLPEYTGEVESRFTRDPLSKFVRDLRHFILHFRLPAIGSTVKLSDNGMEVSIQMLRDDLESSSVWTAPAKTYLSQHGGHIDLAQVVDSYYQTVSNFHEWFREKQETIHRSEFSIAEQKRRLLLVQSGLETVKKLPEKIEAYRRNPDPKLLSHLFTGLLSAEDLYELREFDEDPNVWLEAAMDKASHQHPIPREVRDEILALLRSD